jgi:hypothetical protein
MVEQLELISISLAESEDSPLRADGQESKQSHSAKSNHTPSESSEKTSQEFGYSKTFGNFQQLNFASLSCLPEDTRASLSVKPASAEAQKMTATSGRRCLELSEHQGRLGYLLKMLLDTLRWASTKCLLTWKAKTTPCNRLLFQLAPWTPRTDEIESGLWPTIATKGYGHAAEGMIGIFRKKVEQGALTEKEAQKMIGASLRPKRMKAWLYPTPTTQDASNNGGASQYNRNTLPLNAEIGGALNPIWVEWLMGYPEGWTDCKDSETQSFRKSPTKSSKQ